MNLAKAQLRVKTLTVPELRHFMQMAQGEIDNYAVCIENYPPDRLEKYAKPFMAKLIVQRDVFKDELNLRGEICQP